MKIIFKNKSVHHTRTVSNTEIGELDTKSGSKGENLISRLKERVNKRNNKTSENSNNTNKLKQKSIKQKVGKYYMFK